MDHVRYLLGVFAFIVYAPGLLFWFAIHPWARWWRKLGPPRTYFIVFSMLAAVGVLVFHVRGPLLGRDLGTSWTLIGASLLFCGIFAWIGVGYARHMGALEKEPEGGLGVATEAGTWAPTGLDHIRIIAWPDVNELATTISVHMKERNVPEAVDANVILAKRLNSGTWDRAAVARGLTKILSALFVIAKRPHVGFDRRFSSGPYPKFPEAEIEFGLDQSYDQLEKRDDRVRYFWIEVHQDHFLVSFLNDEQCWGFRDDKDEPQLWKLSDIAVDFQRLSRGTMDVAVQFGMKVVGKAGKPWPGPEGEIQIPLELSALDGSQSNRN